MDPATVPLPDEGVALAGQRGDLEVVPRRFDVAFPLPDGRLVGYAPREGDVASRIVPIDASLHGNAFLPVHESPHALAAVLSIAAGRRMETGPESERMLVFLRGTGLVFLQNGETMRYAAGFATLVPAGEPARVWAQGPEDALAIVVQPTGPRAEKRSLLSELEKRKPRPESSP